MAKSVAPGHFYQKVPLTMMILILFIFFFEEGLVKWKRHCIKRFFGAFISCGINLWSKVIFILRYGTPRTQQRKA